MPRQKKQKEETEPELSNSSDNSDNSNREVEKKKKKKKKPHEINPENYRKSKKSQNPEETDDETRALILKDRRKHRLNDDEKLLMEERIFQNKEKAKMLRLEELRIKLEEENAFRHSLQARNQNQVQPHMSGDQKYPITTISKEPEQNRQEEPQPEFCSIHKCAVCFDMKSKSHFKLAQLREDGIESLKMLIQSISINLEQNPQLQPRPVINLQLVDASLMTKLQVFECLFRTLKEAK